MDLTRILGTRHNDSSQPASILRKNQLLGKSYSLARLKTFEVFDIKGLSPMVGNLFLHSAFTLPPFRSLLLNPLQ